MESDWPKRNKSHYVTEIVSWLRFANVIFSGDKRQPEICLHSHAMKIKAIDKSKLNDSPELGHFPHIPLLLTLANITETKGCPFQIES